MAKTIETEYGTITIEPSNKSNIEIAESAARTVGTGLKMLSECGIGVLLGAFTQYFMPEVGIPIKICVWVGTKILGGTIMEKTDDYIDRYTDEAIDIYKQIDEAVKGAVESGN